MWQHACWCAVVFRLSGLLPHRADGAGSPAAAGVRAHRRVLRRPPGRRRHRPGKRRQDQRPSPRRRRLGRRSADRRRPASSGRRRAVRPMASGPRPYPQNCARSEPVNASHLHRTWPIRFLLRRVLRAVEPVGSEPELTQTRLFVGVGGVDHASAIAAITFRHIECSHRIRRIFIVSRLFVGSLYAIDGAQ